MNPKNLIFGENNDFRFFAQFPRPKNPILKESPDFPNKLFWELEKSHRKKKLIPDFLP